MSPKHVDFLIEKTLNFDCIDKCNVIYYVMHKGIEQKNNPPNYVNTLSYTIVIFTNHKCKQLKSVMLEI